MEIYLLNSMKQVDGEKFENREAWLNGGEGRRLARIRAKCVRDRRGIKKLGRANSKRVSKRVNIALLRVLM